eukprot:1309834-Rhodomonas_salina.1
MRVIRSEDERDTKSGWRAREIVPDTRVFQSALETCRLDSMVQTLGLRTQRAVCMNRRRKRGA